MVERGNFFYLNVELLKFGGVWVPERQEAAKKKWYKLYNAAWLSYSMVFFTIAQLLALKDSYQNRSDLIRNLNMVSSFIVSTYKIANWFFWRKRILWAMDTLQTTLKVLDKHEEFDPETVVTKSVNFKDCLLKIFDKVTVAVAFSCFLNRLFEVTFHGEKYEVFSNVTGYGYVQDLPYRSWVPFDHKSSKFRHMAAVVMQCLALFSCGTITVGLDMLYTSLLIFTTVHFELLQGAFKTIRRKCIKKLNIQCKHLEDPPELIEATEVELKKYLRHLQTILEICQLLEDIYCYLILAQLLVSLVVLCTGLFLVSTVPIGSVGNDLAYFLAIENQLALYCYAANELTHSGSKLPQALFEDDWVSMSKKYGDYTRFTMMRMSKPVHLTIGKFMPLTLNTFVTIGRASYSFLAILKR